MWNQTCLHPSGQRGAVSAALALGLLALVHLPSAGAALDYRPLDHEAQGIQQEVLEIGADAYTAADAARAGPAERQDALGTLVRLLALQRQGQAQGDEDEVNRARLEFDYGLHEDALALLNRLSDRAIGPSARDRFRLALAKTWAERGDLDRAADMLSQLSAVQGSAEQAERSLLQAGILMAKERNAEAAALLENVQSPPEWAAYARFNRAAALARAGRGDAAASVLESLGRIESTDQEMLALRDKANIALGFLRLAGRQPGPAKDAFNRVRLDSPFSTKALYGLGWSDFEQGNVARALIPWNELQQRRVTDSTVQEVWLMVPYAQWRSGAYRDAVQSYREAVSLLVDDLKQFDTLAADARTGALVNALIAANTGDLPGGAITLPGGYPVPYLIGLTMDGRYVEAFTTYRHLRDQQQRLDQWAKRLQGSGVHADLQTRIAAAQSRLSRALAAHEAFLGDLAQSWVEPYRRRTERLQLRAREELARLLDEIALGAGRK